MLAWAHMLVLHLQDKTWHRRRMLGTNAEWEEEMPRRLPGWNRAAIPVCM